MSREGHETEALRASFTEILKELQQHDEEERGEKKIECCYFTRIK